MHRQLTSVNFRIKRTALFPGHKIKFGEWCIFRNMKKIFSALAILFAALALHAEAFNKRTIVHSAATSDDGKWTLLSVLDFDNSEEESIWLYATERHYYAFEKAITFEYVKGWTVPTICFDHNTKSFIVYHNSLSWEHNSQQGFYEFFYENGEYKPDNYEFSSYRTSETGKLYSNDVGVYLYAIYGKMVLLEEGNWDSDIRNCTLYKIVRSGGRLKPVEIESLKGRQFYHICKRGEEHTSNLDWYNNVVFPTKTGMILLDANKTDWWYLDCLTDNITKFKSKQAALAYDRQLYTGNLFKESYKSKISLLSFLILLFLFSSIFILVFSAVKMKVLKRQSIAFTLENTKEKNKFIFSIQEKERSKISRDIHDSVVQDIRVIRLETENLKVCDESKPLQSRIENIATECIIKLRNICYNLAPAELANHSEGDSSEIELVSIINSLAQQFSARTHVPCSVGIQDGFEYPVLKKEVTQNLFRVVQEALNNIEKHSYATETSILIKGEDNKIIIFITDNGIGCDDSVIENSLESRKHFGLRSMKDRIDLIGGNIKFISSQDNGMEVRIEMEI